jgi:hypothetical protein
MGYPVRPTAYLGWCSTGATNVAEPTDLKKARGWGIGEKPASSYLNWIHQTQDAGLQYLDWKSQLDPVVEDDFAYEESAAHATGYIGGTFVPKWVLTARGAGIGGTPKITNEINLTSPFFYGWTRDALGVLILETQGGQAPNLGLNEAYARVGNLNGRDFKAEFIAYDASVASGQTGTAVQFGFYDASGVATGSSGLLMGFMYTGPSGLPMATWAPSGGGATSIAGATRFYQAWTKYTIEARSPTMAFYFNDALIGAAPFVQFGASGKMVGFGARIMYPAGAGTSGLFVGVDRASLRVRRSPT